MRNGYLAIYMLAALAVLAPGIACPQDAAPVNRLTTLLESLKDPDPAVRQAAARTVGESRDKAAVAPLSVVLDSDRDETVRLAALGALLMIDDKSALPAYVKALRDGSEDVRMSAAEALSGQWDEAAQKGLMDALKSDSSYKVRRSAAQSLGNPGIMGRYSGHKWDNAADTVAALVRALREDESREVRATAAAVLGKFNDDKAADALMEALDRDKDATVRAAAAESLNSTGSPKVTDRLLDIVYFETDEQVLIGALKSLRSSGDERLAEPLVKLLRSGSPKVRWQAIDVLEVVRAPGAVASLKEMADDRYETEGVRAKAREALGLLGVQ